MTDRKFEVCLGRYFFLQIVFGVNVYQLALGIVVFVYTILKEKGSKWEESCARHFCSFFLTGLMMN